MVRAIRILHQETRKMTTIDVDDATATAAMEAACADTIATGDAETPCVPQRFLTDEQIEEFLRNGVLVVPNVLTSEEIAAARAGLHNELAKYGVDHADLETTGHNLKKLSSTGGAGGILDLFYPSWRLRVAQHERVFAAISDLWRATYASGTHADFAHPHGAFNAKQGFMYINRVCYRVPDAISQLHADGASKKKRRAMQRSLTPHLDLCPTTMFASDKEIPRWRPIQCITVLTDNTEPNTGGFECVPGFHKEFARYFATKPLVDTPASTEGDELRAPVCLGDFSPLRMQEDKQLIARYQHISASAGSVILFDWRLPHANSYKHVGSVPREVVYTGFLPRVPENERYACEQLRRYRQRLLPADHWQKALGDTQVEEQFSQHHFSALGARLIGLFPWD